MKFVRKSSIFAIAIVAILGLSLISAGCIGSMQLFPSEVSNHGNTIYVNPDYVSSTTLTEMLLDPENYEKNLFEAVELYLPKDAPVVDVGVGTGAVMAYINNNLRIPKQHLAVEPNPYLIPDLQKTIDKNLLVIDLRQAAVGYGQTDPYVPLIVTKDLSENIVAPQVSTETVSVPVTTVMELIAGSSFDQNTNVTLVVEVNDLLKTIFQNEEHNLKTQIACIIGTMSEMKLNEVESFLNYAHNAGYQLEYTAKSSDANDMTYVFTRKESVEEQTNTS